MRKRWIAAATAVAAMMVWVPSASAVEVGNNCTANVPAANVVFLQVSRATPSSIPLTVPSAGIVTSWRVQSSLPTSYSEKLKVFRSAGGPKQFTTIAESATATVVPGNNVFNTQIPVQAGDRFGVFGGGGPTGASLLCGTSNAGDEYGAFAPDTPVGSTNEFSTGGTILVGVSAVVEPDADGDGFGDESQDKCPRSAKVQAVECPLITLSSFGLASRNSALILLASSSATAVNVSGTVKVPGATKKNGKKGKAKTLKLSGGAQNVTPGQLARFVVSYSVPLKAALTALPPSKTLALKVTASTIDLAGTPSSTTTTLKLKGQAKAGK